MSDEQYEKFLAKDANAYLKHNQEYIIGAMMMGYDASQVFVTCDEEQVKEIYKAILSVISQRQWSAQKVEEAIANANPLLTEYEVTRIRRTELQRILNFAKEQSALEEGDRHYYAWIGALDDRTTAICRFLQTGELSHTADNPNFSKLDYNYEYLRDRLPEWQPQRPLNELKEFVKETYDVFHEEGIITTEMVSDWSTHINCRHTFTQTSVIPDDELEEVDIDNFYPAEDAMEMVADINPANEVVVEEVNHGDNDFIFINSRFYSQPTYYFTPDAKDEDTVFAFEHDEFAVAEESDYIEQQLMLGKDINDLQWELKEHIHFNNLNDDELNWLFFNNRFLWFNQIAEERGWLI